MLVVLKSVVQYCGIPAQSADSSVRGMVFELAIDSELTEDAMQDSGAVPWLTASFCSSSGHCKSAMYCANVSLVDDMPEAKSLSSIDDRV